jgi:glycosyltransferase involved in cell wall biosynthesis
VIPTYKRPDLLVRLLQSIVKQSYKASEIIVVDDCSGMSDEYIACIERFNQLACIKYICLEKNSGAPIARNRGIAEAKSEWVALVDDDDEWLPNKLEKQVELIQSNENPKLGLVYTWAEAKGDNGQESYDSCISVSGDARKALLSTNFIMSASVVVKKEALLAVKGFNTSLPSCQDWDMWIRISLAGYHIDVVKEILTIYHRHGGESIGLSSNAKLGYRMLLESHWRDIAKYTSILNKCKKLWLYIKVRIATYGI